MAEGDSQTVERLFEQAVAHASGPEREAFLNGACAGDSALRDRVEALLRAHDAAGSFLEEPAAPSDHTVAAALSEGPGSVIDKYKLLQLIGEGGFGVVYMAEQRKPVRRKVALKIIKLGMDTKQVIARFEAERQALAMMDHPNIAKVLDAGATETGRPYFVMELVKGEPITEYCDKHNLDVRERLALFQQVCHAVQHAHQKGIIHRDLKPSNVMITLHDGKPVPKVIDFGIAKATNARLTEKTVFTEYRQFIGTPEYMSPEQAEMSGLDIDTRSDVYALGVLLYELLTGTTPFDGATLRSAGYGEIQRIIREETPHKPSTRLSTLETLEDVAQHRHTEPKKLGLTIRGDLDWIVMKALEKDRQRRYETANGFAMDIERYLHDEPVVASPPSTSYKLKKLIKRNKGVFTAAAMIFLVLTLGVIGTTWGMVATQAQAERAERELVRANEVKRLITEMFDSVSPEVAQGSDITLLKGILDDTAARLESGAIQDQLIAAEMHLVIGNVYASLGLYRQADTHLQVALEIRRRELGEEHPDTLGSMNNLAMLYVLQGRYADAEPLHEKTLTIKREVLGEEHPNTLDSMNNSALLYQRQGRYAESESLSLKCLEIRRRVLGDEHRDTLGTMTNLGCLYNDMGRYDDAAIILERSLQTKRHVLGEDDPWTLVAMHGLAGAYDALGRYADAESLYREAMEIQRDVLNEGHPDTLRTMHNLAALYRAQGRYERAESLCLETLSTMRRVLGEKHPNTLTAMSTLGGIYRAQSRYAEAEPLYVEALESRKDVLGPEHPNTIQSMDNLAILYVDQRRYTEAEQMFLDTLELRRQVFGEKQRATLRMIVRLAALYELQARYTDAESLYREALEIQRNVLGEENRDTLGTITNLGNLYRKTGQYEKAAEMYEWSLPIKRRELTVDDPWTRKAIAGLARTYEALDRRTDALPLWGELLDFEVSTVDDTNAAALNSVAWNLLTHDYDELRDPVSALELAQRACDLERANGGDNLWMYVDTLALAQHMTGDSAAAVETQRRAIELMPDSADPEMPQRLAEYEAALANEVEMAGNGDEQ